MTKSPVFLPTNSAEEPEKLKKRIKKDNIDDLSSMAYEKYLNTALWKKIKQWVFERDDNKCLVCGRIRESKNDEFDVHHRSYELEVLEGKRDDLLVTLCRRCHKIIEYYPNKRKKSDIKEKDREYFRLKNIHEEIEGNGLALTLSENTLRGASNIVVEYTGKEEYKLFYSIESLLFFFVFKLSRQYRGELLTPRPLGASTLFAKNWSCGN